MGNQGPRGPTGSSGKRVEISSCFVDHLVVNVWPHSLCSGPLRAEKEKIEVMQTFKPLHRKKGPLCHNLFSFLINGLGGS